MSQEKLDIVIVGAHWRTPHLSLWRYWQIVVNSPGVRWQCVDVCQDADTVALLAGRPHVEVLEVPEEQRFDVVRADAFQHGVDHALATYEADYLMVMHSDAWPVQPGWFKAVAHGLGSRCRATGYVMEQDPAWPNRKRHVRCCYCAVPFSDARRFRYDWCSNDWPRHTENVDELGVTVWDAAEKVSIDIHARGGEVSALNSGEYWSPWLFHKGHSDPSTLGNRNAWQHHLEMTIKAWQLEGR